MQNSTDGHGHPPSLCMDFIKDLTHSHEKAEQQPPPSPPPEHRRGFLGKLGDAVDDLSGKPHHDAPPPPPPPAPKENIFGKISDALKGEDHTSPPPPPPQKPEGLFDKLSDVIHGHEAHEQPRKPEKNSEKFGDRINNAFGGGSSGEAKEGVLDKAIDFYQEHVLKQGKQDNESAIEQAKDKQIAGVIRHGYESVTGKELPSSHKK